MWSLPNKGITKSCLSMLHVSSPRVALGEATECETHNTYISYIRNISEISTSARTSNFFYHPVWYQHDKHHPEREIAKVQEQGARQVGHQEVVPQVWGMHRRKGVAEKPSWKNQQNSTERRRWNACGLNDRNKKRY